MNITEFLKKYKLSKDLFCKMVHVGMRTLNKYIEGKPIREDSRERIERGMQIVIEHNLVGHEYQLNMVLGSTSSTIHMEEVRKYKKNFEKLFNEES